jgi:hypothetical protein
MQFAVCPLSSDFRTGRTGLPVELPVSHAATLRNIADKAPVVGRAVQAPVIALLGRRPRSGTFAMGRAWGNLWVFAFSVPPAYLLAMFKPFESCVPTKASNVPNGPDWLHCDGYRLRLEREATACG